MPLQYFKISPNIAIVQSITENCHVLNNIAKYHSKLPSIHQYYIASHNIAKYHPILPNIHQYCQVSPIWPSITQYRQVSQSITQYCQQRVDQCWIFETETGISKVSRKTRTETIIFKFFQCCQVSSNIANYHPIWPSITQFCQVSHIIA